MHIFPYSTIDGTGYIFSALDCPCSLEDIDNALSSGVISDSYRTQLIANFYKAGEMPKAAQFKPV